jgi:hypothetical protein
MKIDEINIKTKEEVMNPSGGRFGKVEITISGHENLKIAKIECHGYTLIRC